MAPKFRVYKRRTARSFPDTNQGKTGDKAGPRRLVRRFFYSRSVVTILFETTIAFRVHDAPPAPGGVKTQLQLMCLLRLFISTFSYKFADGFGSCARVLTGVFKVRARPFRTARRVRARALLTSSFPSENPEKMRPRSRTNAISGGTR
jgi:hypothetical protein